MSNQLVKPSHTSISPENMVIGSVHSEIEWLFLLTNHTFRLAGMLGGLNLRATSADICTMSGFLIEFLSA